MLNTFTYDDVRIVPARQIGLNSHARWELSMILCGRGKRSIGEKTEPIVEGEIILLPPNVEHVWRFDPGHTDAEGMIHNISVFFTERVIEGLAALFPELKESMGILQAQKEAISYSGKSRERIADHLLAMRGLSDSERLPLMIQLLMELADVRDVKAVGGRMLQDRITRRCEEVRIYCRCNYARDITLEEVARHVGMNKSAFCTFMRRHMGNTLTNYVNSLRLERIKENLTAFPDRTVSEIATDCGFNNITYFNRLFRTRYGESPTEFRKRAQTNRRRK